MLSAALDGILARQKAWKFLFGAAIGALAALGQAPFGLWPLTMLALGVLLAFLRRAQSAKQAMFLAWAAGAGYFALALFWLVEPFLVDVARHGWLAPFALLGASAGFGFYWALAGFVTFKVRGQAIGFACAFVVFEALRGVLFTGFPWAQIGHVLIDTPLLHLASYAGSLGLTFVVLIGAVAVASMIERKTQTMGVAAAALVVLFAIAITFVPNNNAMPDAPIIRIVHTNEPQEERWDPRKIPGNFERKLTYTAGDRTGPKPDLIVWPETSIPVLLSRADAALSAIGDEAAGTPVVAGLQRFDGDSFYNSLIRLNGEGDVDLVYDKHHLVPFGEYMPFGDVLARFGILGLADTTGGGYEAGPGPVVVDMGALGLALPLICYEGVFPRDVGGYDIRPDFLMLITNDAWFGAIAGPYQHLVQARLRSAEQGLPMIRSANTGISAMIDATGQVTHQLDLDEAGWIDAPLPPALPKTLYARFGDLPIVVLALFLIGFTALHRKPGVAVSS